ncbi:MAG: type II secretion system F family protein [Lachnospiraceae bacterium]|nr:type II secretion system F family protein [Lachnospiraceae bacterium]
MGKKQIEKDFSKLYVGQNQELLIENYYKKKKKDMLLLFLAGSILMSLLAYQTFQQRRLAEGNSIERNPYGRGKKEVTLEVQREEEAWQPITVTLGEKEYSKEEVESYFQQLADALPQIILGENESVDQISKDLNLPQEVEGYPLLLSWRSSNNSLVDSQGRIRRDKEPEGETPENGQAQEDGIVELTVTMEYGEWKQEHHLFVRVIDEEEGTEDSFLRRLSAGIQAEERESREEEFLFLPRTEGGKELNWRYPTGKGVFILFLFLPIVLAAVWYEKDKEVHKQAQERDRCLQAQYSEFVSKLTLLMEAGMTVKGALYRIVQDDRQKRGKGKRIEFLYEELGYICRRMENGLGEIEAYELLGRRCSLPLYRKLSTLLIQTVQKGAANILDTLRQESWRANEERKNQVKRKGEEAGTKLLLPMMLMLGMVMILIIVPACFSFQL